MDQIILDVIKTGSLAGFAVVMYWYERKERIEVTKLLHASYKDNLEAFHKVEEALKDLTATISPRRRT